MKLRKRLRVMLAAALLVTTLAPIRPCAAGTLYDDLGRKAGITKVLVDMAGFIAGDARVGPFVARAGLADFERELVDQICYATGGPCTYSAKSVQAARSALHVNEAGFDALVEDLQKSMYKNDVPPAMQNRLIEVVAPLLLPFPKDRRSVSAGFEPAR
jgi:hemoglobin